MTEQATVDGGATGHRTAAIRRRRPRAASS